MQVIDCNKSLVCFPQRQGAVAHVRVQAMEGELSRSEEGITRRERSTVGRSEALSNTASI